MDNTVINTFTAGVVVSAIQWTLRLLGLSDSNLQRLLALGGSLGAGAVVAGVTGSVSADEPRDIFSIGIGVLISGQAIYVIVQSQLKETISKITGK